MFGNDRNQMRRAYADAWYKFQQGQPLQPLEQQIAEVISEHPEYHKLLNNIEADFFPEAGETNPFLHMGMHLAIREQMSTNRPMGIINCFQLLTKKTSDSHGAEHEMMECLGEALWQAQRNGSLPDEAAYLACLKQRATSKK
ncbi:MAG: DUF1841 family protein [Gammaproteobacteria bacterium]|nr:DUF1841 family protein [Gammaproteobacteria bacterium]